MKMLPLGFVGDKMGALLVAASARVSKGDLREGCTFRVLVSTGGKLDAFAFPYSFF